MPFEILLVDDNAGDVRLLQEAFRESTTLSMCTWLAMALRQ